MTKILKSIVIVFLLIIITAIGAVAQMDELHGTFDEHKNGLHAGNLFRTTIYNDGTFGRKVNPPDIAGEWPINSGRIYMIDGNLFVGSEVIDENGQLQHIISTVTSAGDGSSGSWSSGDTDPETGEWWTFLPLPGFSTPDTNKIAMSKWEWAWPAIWPDKWDDPVDPGWAGAWNGYFGKDQFNADEEAFFVADDYMNREFAFYPDENDRDRKGLGLRLWVRTFQWSNALVEDGMFALFDIENVGTHHHDKMMFAYKFGNNMGDTMTASDGGDDMGGFRREVDAAFLYDFDDLGGGGWSPVGYFGGVFLESPGNPVDGIDNDGDGANGPGNVITTDMFAPRTLAAGDQVVVIDYTTFERTVQTLTGEISVPYQDIVYKFAPGDVVEEIANNLVDDNLNGLIDENNGAIVGEGDNARSVYLFEGLKYIDYAAGETAEMNPLIEERRDDGIDNDGDWDPEFDDLGQDGAPNTGDPGEGDGVPTYGEPKFDKTDIDETDMIGLTSFTLYRWENIPHYEDELVWQNTLPGLFDDYMENDNIELLYGSGYFPLVPGSVERFSMGILCGVSEEDFLENSYWVAKAYGENYNFAKAPIIPTVTAVAGDGQVTLLWNDAAESSYDPIGGYDFEGYKIYRSTDPGWNDMMPITDGKGFTTYRKPLAQFDLDNEYEGFSPVPIKGVEFWMGDNSGIVNSYVDSTVTNGQKYYYAVVSYDHGMPEGSIAPTECSKFISIATTGEIDKGANVAIVTPNAPSAGFLPASAEAIELVEGGTATGAVGFELINPKEIKDEHTYRIMFDDSLYVPTGAAEPYDWHTTAAFLVDATNPSALDTIASTTDLTAPLPIIDGFQVSLVNHALAMNETASGWNNEGLHAFQFIPFRYSKTKGIPSPDKDFRIEFGEVGMDTSVFFEAGSRKYDEEPVNFSVYDNNTNEKLPFAWREQDDLKGEEGMFTGFTDRTRSDLIIILDDSSQATWEFSLVAPAADDTLSRNPMAGDVVTIVLDKPFLSHDVFEFVTHSARIDEDLVDLDKIRVVPNPYVVSNSWEPLNPYANGRGPRELHFTHLPAQCTIRIFNVRGQLVKKLEHNTPDIADGVEVWDMQTKDLLDIAYGIYVYHIDAGELGEKTGKFAVIK